MKIKSIVSLLLLFVISFSLVHEFAFAYLDDEHCSTSEYIAELERPTECGDICDVHYEYHAAYILPNTDLQFITTQINDNQITENDTYLFQTYSKTIKPPIV